MKQVAKKKAAAKPKISSSKKPISLTAAFNRLDQDRVVNGLRRQLRRVVRTHDQKSEEYKRAKLALSDEYVLFALAAESYARYSVSDNNNENGKFFDAVIRFLSWVMENLPEIIELISIITEVEGKESE